MRTPRIVYAGATLNLAIPAMPWSYATLPVGGTAKADSGAAASFVRRTEHLIDVTLRFYDAERVAVETWLDAVRNDVAFTFRFHATDAGTAVTVFVDAPMMGERRQLERDPEYPGAWRLALTLRTSAGARHHVPFYAVA